MQLHLSTKSCLAATPYSRFPVYLFHIQNKTKSSAAVSCARSQLSFDAVAPSHVKKVARLRYLNASRVTLEHLKQICSCTCHCGAALQLHPDVSYRRLSCQWIPVPFASQGGRRRGPALLRRRPTSGRATTGGLLMTKAPVPIASHSMCEPTHVLSIASAPVLAATLMGYCYARRLCLVGWLIDVNRIFSELG